MLERATRTTAGSPCPDRRYIDHYTVQPNLYIRYIVELRIIASWCPSPDGDDGHGRWCRLVCLRWPRCGAKRQASASRDKSTGQKGNGCATTLSPIKAIMEANVKWSRREEVVVW